MDVITIRDGAGEIKANVAHVGLISSLTSGDETLPLDGLLSLLFTALDADEIDEADDCVLVCEEVSNEGDEAGDAFESGGEADEADEVDEADDDEDDDDEENMFRTVLTRFLGPAVFFLTAEKSELAAAASSLAGLSDDFFVIVVIVWLPDFGDEADEDEADDD